MLEQDFDRARRRASWNRIVAFLHGKPSLLLPFELVRERIDIGSSSYGGIREIEIAKVIGSVNRYHEFDREFLPRHARTADRWLRVRRMFEESPGFPPITVYQVDDAYFVVDGNHRVSVARRLGAKRIEAEVTCFHSDVPIDEKTDVQALIIKSEYSAFLRHTNLDTLRPRQRIEFTRPGRYAILLEHIEKRRYYVGQQTGEEVPYEQAVLSWYDGLYRPLIEIFNQEKLLERFPGRTEADLYVWVTGHLYFLREQFGDEIGLDEATRDFARRRSPLTRLFDRVLTSTRLRKHASRPAGGSPALGLLERRLTTLERHGVAGATAYRVPRAWSEGTVSASGVDETNPIAFWRSAVERIRTSPPMPRDDGAAGEWSRGSTVYNLLVRASCAFDHNGDGRIDLLNADGVRETGTFVKAIALLPYIRDLGCNAVHLLPVCRIGQDGRKGELGSPYAIANPYELEDTLAEPLLGLGAETEFKAFVEAAHHLGIRVVLEFVLRTAAKDSDWIAEHPEWFYWIDESVPDRSPDTPSTGGYGSPTFSADELDRIRTLVANSQFSRLPVPPEAYRALFAVPPRSENVRYENSRFVGITETGRDVRIPGAFADWPPDDPQPPWSDVTYLRLYDHTDFNYVAYNTIRMYDDRLATPNNAVSGLWDRITGIMPHFQNRFAIDGAMIDMGHALPALLKAQVIAGARGVNPTFGFWDEDFRLLESARRDGYNAAVGNLWWMVHHPERLRRDVFDRLATEGVPIPAFATPETHNTRRCAAREGGVERSLYCWTIGAFLPAIPYIHSGFELGEVRPVNTGLDFTPEEIRRFPPESLPLYSPCEYAWIGDPSLREGIRRVLSIRRDVATLVIDSTPDTFDVPITHGEAGVTYVRRDNRQWLLVVGNPTAEALRVRLSGLRIPDGTAIDRIRGRETQIVDGRADFDLAPWECRVFAGPL